VDEGPRLEEVVAVGVLDVGAEVVVRAHHVLRRHVHQLQLLQFALLRHQRGEVRLPHDLVKLVELLLRAHRGHGLPEHVDVLLQLPDFLGHSAPGSAELVAAQVFAAVRVRVRGTLEVGHLFVRLSCIEIAHLEPFIVQLQGPLFLVEFPGRSPSYVGPCFQREQCLAFVVNHLFVQFHD